MYQKSYIWSTSNEKYDFAPNTIQKVPLFPSFGIAPKHLSKSWNLLNWRKGGHPRPPSLQPIREVADQLAFRPGRFITTARIGRLVNFRGIRQKRRNFDINLRLHRGMVRMRGIAESHGASVPKPESPESLLASMAWHQRWERPVHKRRGISFFLK